jgi:hypothetical protein
VTATVGEVPVKEFSATVIVAMASFPRLPPKVATIVPIPAVKVPAVRVTPALPTVPKARKAVCTLASRVAFVADQLIAPVVCPANESLKLPPEGVPPMVMVCTSLVPLEGAPAKRRCPKAPGMVFDDSIVGINISPFNRMELAFYSPVTIGI